MEQVKASLSELLEQEADLLCTCKDYLRNEMEKPASMQTFVMDLLEIHNPRFDEIEAQLTRLEGAEG